MAEFIIDRGHEGKDIPQAIARAPAIEVMELKPATPSLSGVPTEILLLISSHLLQDTDIVSLVYLNRRLHYLFQGIALRRNIETRHSHALIWAAANNRLELVSALIEAGADLNACYTTYARTPLGEACRNGHVRVVRLLLDAGANKERVEGRWRPGEWLQKKGDVCPLALAMIYGHVDAALVITSGLDESNIWYDTDYTTHLSLAARYGFALIVKAMLEKSANGKRGWPQRGCRAALDLLLKSAYSRIADERLNEYLQTAMLLLEYWEDTEPKFFRMTNRRGHFLGWSPTPDLLHLGKYHADPRVRVLCSREILPFERQGAVPSPERPWTTGVTEPEIERLSRSQPGSAIFDLNMFKLYKDRHLLTLEEPFPRSSVSGDPERLCLSYRKRCRCTEVHNIVFADRNCQRGCVGLKGDTSSQVQDAFPGTKLGRENEINDIKM
jgi:hypothetical protein